MKAKTKKNLKLKLHNSKHNCKLLVVHTAKVSYMSAILGLILKGIGLL